MGWWSPRIGLSQIWWKVKKRSKNLWASPLRKRWLVRAYCVNMVTSNLFILVMWWSLARLKSYWTFWIFCIFVTCCYMHTICIFWHLFPSFPYFGITFHLYHILVSQYVISIDISFQSVFHFGISFQAFPHFSPIFCHFFPSLPYDHNTKGFVFYKNQKIKMTLEEWK